VDTALSLLISAGIVAFGFWIVVGTITAGSPFAWTLLGLLPVYIDKLHSAAFRDLESEVSDLDRMGEIARNLIMNCAAREDSFHDLELATFAVCQLAKMANEFKTNYQKRSHGEKRGDR
jgi:hypothetical protein